MLRGKPRKPTSVYAAWGTVAHTLMEQTLTKLWSLKQLEAELGKKYEQDGHSITVDKEMISCVSFYCHDVVLKLANEIFFELFGRAPRKEEYKNFLFVEQKIHLHEIDKELYGTADTVIAFYPYKLIVLDLKTGTGVAVDQNDNEQAKFYGLRAWMDGDYEEADLYIIQPRLFDGEPKPFKVDREGMERFKVDLKAKVLATRDPNAPLIPSEDACRWCEAIVECPAHRKLIEEASLARFEDLDRAEALVPAQQLTPEQRAFAMGCEKLISRWFKSVREYSKQLAIAGEQTPGYKIVKKYGDRTWADKEKAIAMLEPKLGDDLFKAPELKGIGEIEKLIGKKTFAATYEAELIHKPFTGEELVKEEDKRQEINKSADTLFELLA